MKKIFPHTPQRALATLPSLFTLLLAALLAAPCLTSCGGDDDDDPPTEKPVMLTFREPCLDFTLSPAALRAWMDRDMPEYGLVQETEGVFTYEASDHNSCVMYLYLDGRLHTSALSYATATRADYSKFKEQLTSRYGGGLYDDSNECTCFTPSGRGFYVVLSGLNEGFTVTYVAKSGI